MILCTVMGKVEEQEVSNGLKHQSCEPDHAAGDVCLSSLLFVQASGLLGIAKENY